jgi:malonate decarboxylase epsilon subunit
MLHTLGNHPAVEETLNEISQALEYDVRAFDSPEALKSTVPVQLAFLAAGVASARALRRDGLEPSAVAGLSVGAFSAAVSVDAISLADAVTLVRSRAEQMEQMYPVGYGLAAIVGLIEKHVSRLVELAYTNENPVFVANINAPRQIVIAGSIDGMKKVLDDARSQGARKAEFLNVSVPSHCSLMQPIADSLLAQLGSMSVSDPKVPYIANVTARAIRTAQGVARDLADNIAHGVRWHDATVVAHELGCDLFLEMPPGHTLRDLAQENIPGISAYSMTNDNFDHVLKLAAS